MLRRALALGFATLALGAPLALAGSASANTGDGPVALPGHHHGWFHHNCDVNRIQFRGGWCPVPPPVPVPTPIPTAAHLIIGSNANDILQGTVGRDYIFGLGGNDRLVGKAGNDHLYGGPGNDVLVAGPGTDVLRGGAGFDRCVGDDNDQFLNCEVTFIIPAS